MTLDIARGQVVAVLGKSGSGKTTLLNLISGIDRVDEGEIILDGQRLTSLAERAAHPVPPPADRLYFPILQPDPNPFSVGRISFCRLS